MGPVKTEYSVRIGEPVDLNTGMTSPEQGRSMTEMSVPGNTIAIAESWAIDGGDCDNVFSSPDGSIITGCDTWKFAGRSKANPSASDLFEACSEYTAPTKIPTLGHQGRANYLFADGHVRSLTWAQIRTNDFQLLKLRK